jgi:hypothetical protein
VYRDTYQNAHSQGEYCKAEISYMDAAHVSSKELEISQPASSIKKEN